MKEKKNDVIHFQVPFVASSFSFQWFSGESSNASRSKKWGCSPAGTPAQAGRPYTWRRRRCRASSDRAARPSTAASSPPCNGGISAPLQRRSSHLLRRPRRLKTPELQPFSASGSDSLPGPGPETRNSILRFPAPTRGYDVLGSQHHQR